MNLNSALYEGTVRHRRHQPFEHQFEYELFMLYLDLDELDEVFDSVPGWSTEGFAPAWFRRADHTGDPEIPLDTTIRDRVEQETGNRPDGSIRLLTNLRYFGYCFNPVSFYVCFGPDDQTIEALVAEVSNTPWRDMHCYVLSRDQGSTTVGGLECYFDKEFFVSPFMPPDLGYRLEFDAPGDQFRIQMDSYRAGQRNFDATLELGRREISATSLTKRLLRTPMMTLKVILAIYYEALKIWFKEHSTYYQHPPDGNLSGAGDPT